MIRCILGLVLAFSLFVGDAQAYFTDYLAYCRKNFSNNTWSCELGVQYQGGLPVNNPINFCTVRIAFYLVEDGTSNRYRVGESGTAYLSNTGAGAVLGIYGMSENDSGLNDENPEIEIQVWDDDNDVWYSVQHIQVFDTPTNITPTAYDCYINSNLVNRIDVNLSGSTSYLYVGMTTEAGYDGNLSKQVRFYMQPLDSNGYQTGNEVYIGSLSCNNFSISQVEKELDLTGTGVHEYGEYAIGGDLQIRARFMVFDGSTWNEQFNFQYWVEVF